MPQLLAMHASVALEPTRLLAQAVQLGLGGPELRDKLRSDAGSLNSRNMTRELVSHPTVLRSQHPASHHQKS